MIGRRQGRSALEAIKRIQTVTPFTEIARALAILDAPPPDWDAIDACLATASRAPDYLWHLIPWHSAKILPDRLPKGYGKQEAISLRLVKRPDLGGALVRRAHQAGLKGSDGTPFLVDVSAERKPCEGSVICLIDGAETSSIAAHIASHGVSPKDYREFFGIR